MVYRSFFSAEDKDITFYSGEFPMPECNAKRIYVTHKVYKLSVYSGLGCTDRMIDCDDPKLEFIREIENNGGSTEPIIYHNGECYQGGIIIDGGLFGAEPLNIVRDEQGVLHQFPYQGNIRIGHNVCIANNVTIARGALDDTIIEDNVMLDSNVFVGNEALIGSGTIVCVGVIIGGGVKIGKNCFIGLGAIINPHIKIGESVIIGSGAVVTKGVDAMDVVAGVPAKSISFTITGRDRYKLVGCSFPEELV